MQRFHIWLAYAPPVPGTRVEVPGAVHCQASRLVIENQPVHTIYVRLILQKIGWIPLEDRLDVRLVALQQEGTSANGALGLLQVPVLLYHFRSDNPHTPWVGQYIEQPDIGLFQAKLHCITVHRRHPVHHGLEHIAVWILLCRQEAAEGELHILRHQLPTVERWLVVPFDALAQMEDIGRVIQCLPAFGQVRLYREGAWRNPAPTLYRTSVL